MQSTSVENWDWLFYSSLFLCMLEFLTMTLILMHKSNTSMALTLLVAAAALVLSSRRRTAVTCGYLWGRPNGHQNRWWAFWTSRAVSRSSNTNTKRDSMTAVPPNLQSSLQVAARSLPQPGMGEESRNEMLSCQDSSYLGIPLPAYMRTSVSSPNT